MSFQRHLPCVATEMIDLKNSIYDTSELDKLNDDLSEAKTKLAANKKDEKKEKAKESPDQDALIKFASAGTSLLSDVARLTAEISDWPDKIRKEQEKHIYRFKNKVYFDKTNHPPYVLKWARKTDNLKSAGVLTKLVRFGYFPIEPNIHGILPDPFSIANIDENGHLVYIDGLLCGIEYEKYIAKRKHEIGTSNAAARAKFAEFENQVKDAGGVIDDEMRDFMGI